MEICYSFPFRQEDIRFILIGIYMVQNTVHLYDIVTLFASSKRTRVLHRANVVNAILDLFSDAEETVDICGNSSFPFAIFYYESMEQAILNAGKKQRYILEITKENITFCKRLMEIAKEVRHLDEAEANFAVSEKEYLGSIALKEPDQRALYINVKEIVHQQQYIFNNLWTKSVRAEDKIIEIGQGKEAEFYQVITDIEKARDVYVELARSIRKEALLLFVNAFAMIRADKIGVIDSLIEASTKKNAKIRIICPITEKNSEILNRISQKSPNIQILNSIGSPSGLFIVDKAKFMRFEIKEPGADKFSEALGFIVYSNSKVAVDSCILFFDLFCNERIHYERLIELEKIKEADKMYKEFINIAAHELRTPVQPIIGLADVLSLHIKDPQQQGILSIIIRNAKRLQRLSNDILDITRIESQALELKIEQFDLNAVVSDCMQDTMNNVQMNGKDVKLLCQPGESAILVQADKARICQVISNLLNNSIKFTEEGTICINIEARDKQVKVSICDTGTGISSDIFPRLFTKFATNSFEGTGLGLFISKKIIEVHKGKIWAQNNPGGKGATFSFILPITQPSD